SLAPQLVALSTVLIGNVVLVWLAWDLALKDLCCGLVEQVSGVFYVLLAYNALAFCYFAVLNASETSLHVHILMTILAEGSIQPQELATRYDAKHMINARIERMIALGQIKE